MEKTINTSDYIDREQYVYSQQLIHNNRSEYSPQENIDIIFEPGAYELDMKQQMLLFRPVIKGIA